MSGPVEQIKALGRFAPAQLIDPLPLSRPRLAAQIVLDQMKAHPGRGDPLHRSAVEYHKARAQRLVARNDRIERGPQGASVQPALQLQTGCKVIRRTGGGIELVQEPQALLADGRGIDGYLPAFRIHVHPRRRLFPYGGASRAGSSRVVSFPV